MSYEMLRKVSLLPLGPSLKRRAYIGVGFLVKTVCGYYLIHRGGVVQALVL